MTLILASSHSNRGRWSVSQSREFIQSPKLVKYEKRALFEIKRADVNEKVGYENPAQSSYEGFERSGRRSFLLPPIKIAFVVRTLLWSVAGCVSLAPGTRKESENSRARRKPTRLWLQPAERIPKRGFFALAVASHSLSTQKTRPNWSW